MATTFSGLRTGGLAPENFLGNRPDFSKLGTAVAMANGLVDIAGQRAENDIAVGKLNADTIGTQFLMNDMAKQAAQGIIDEGQGMRDIVGTGLNIASMFATGGLGGGGNTGNTTYTGQGGAGQGQLLAPLSTGDNATSLLNSFLSGSSLR